MVHASEVPVNETFHIYYQEINYKVFESSRCDMLFFISILTWLICLYFSLSISVSSNHIFLFKIISKFSLCTSFQLPPLPSTFLSSSVVNICFSLPFRPRFFLLSSALSSLLQFLYPFLLALSLLVSLGQDFSFKTPFFPSPSVLSALPKASSPLSSKYSSLLPKFFPRRRLLSQTGSLTWWVTALSSLFSLAPHHLWVLC